jgi:hypothetical protein
MITGTVWAITLTAVGLVATIAAAHVFLGALFPARLARMRGVLRVRPVVATVVGLPLLLLVLFIAKAVGARFELGQGLLGVGALFMALFGMGAAAAEIGDRMPSVGAAAPPWRALVRGSISCSLASLLPFAGWFVVYPLLLGAGFGAWLLSFVGGDRPKAPPPPPPVPARTESLVEAGA